LCINNSDALKYSDTNTNRIGLKTGTYSCCTNVTEVSSKYQNYIDIT